MVCLGRRRESLWECGLGIGNYSGMCKRSGSWIQVRKKGVPIYSVFFLVYYDIVFVKIREVLY